jgi:predicted NBD/HSP70 family sugar kinase
VSWLGIDIGTTNTKACLVSPDGATLAARSRPTATDASRLQADLIELVSGGCGRDGIRVDSTLAAV